VAAAGPPMRSVEIGVRGNYLELTQYVAELERALPGLRWDELAWSAAMAPFKGTKVVTYHRSFPNFAERFGLDIVGYVEPRPGIPPTPQHTLDLIADMKRQGVKLVLVEPYFDLKSPNAIGRATGATVLMVPPSVGGVKEITDYVSLFDYDIKLVSDALRKAGAQ